MPASVLAIAASVASLNLCADEYLLLLANPDEIAAVSYLSHDPRESPLWRSARRHRAVGSDIEQVAALKPQVVLTMGATGRSTLALARRLGIRPVNLRFANDFADIEANFRLVAEALGEPRRATPFIERLDTLRATVAPRAVDAMWISGAGQSFAGGSMGARWMRLANLAQRPLASDRVTLEQILVSPPSVIVASHYRSGQFSLSQRWLDHPIVKRAPSVRIATDGRSWTCLGPLMIAEVERLRAIVR